MYTYTCYLDGKLGSQLFGSSLPKIAPLWPSAPKFAGHRPIQCAPHQTFLQDGGAVQIDCLYAHFSCACTDSTVYLLASLSNTCCRLLFCDTPYFCKPEVPRISHASIFASDPFARLEALLDRHEALQLGSGVGRHRNLDDSLKVRSAMECKLKSGKRR